MVDSPPSARPDPKPNYTADSYLCHLRGWRKYTAAQTEGLLLLQDGSTIAVSNVLFDSGALHSSYISSKLVDKHLDILSTYITKTHGRVLLGDNKTEVNVTQMISIQVQFVDDDHLEHTGKVELVVFPMGHIDMIIGLPDIMGPFFTFFFHLLSGARENADKGQVHALEGDIIYPWTQTITEPAPEEDIVDLPCSFSYALYNMSKPREQLVREFLDAIPKQISPDVIANYPRLVELVKSKGCNVFVPSNWDGINGFEPIHIPVSPDIPKDMKFKARRINPRLWENAKTEYDRLLGYFYVESYSPIASPLVIAPKATYPFLRFCGDYTWINKFIIPLKYPIPIPVDELPKAAQFKYFANIDLTTAFHQLKIDTATSEYLSVITPWGTVRPLFLPEGVTPASAILQKAVVSIFDDFSEWSIVIFDNILLLAHDYDDLYDKLDKFFDRCINRNVALKFSKTTLGFTHAEFFGYIVENGSWRLGTERVEAINAIPMPRTKKLMQSLLGQALIFRHFIPNYSTITAPLHEMCKDTFVWNPESIASKEPYLTTLKEALKNSLTLYFPDYELDWVLHTDASDMAVGSILFQVRILTDGTTRNEPLFCHSSKFSNSALLWDTYKKEGYGVVKGVKDNEYVLRGKHFILKTDCANILYIETHQTPIVMRWLAYLHTFSFDLMHIKGKLNPADYWSRMLNHIGSIVSCDPTFLIEPTPPADSLHNFIAPDSSLETQPKTVEDLFAAVHGGSVGHWGANHTWALLNKHFPGHGIPIRIVKELIAACPTCTKERLSMNNKIPTIRRHLHQPDRFHCIAFDWLTVTPVDDYGNSYLLVIVNLFTKITALYPSKDKEAITTATSLVHYFGTYGVVHNLHSDPGSDFTSELIKELVKYYGITQTFTIVDHPQASGVENTNQKILRHLRALVMDWRCKSKWSDKAILGVISFLINSFDNSEIGVIPYELHFGSDAAKNFKLPNIEGEEKIQHVYLRQLNGDIQQLVEKSKEFQNALALEKLKNNPVVPPKYQEGDYILYDKHRGGLRDEKLTPKYFGPYIVLKQNKNDIECKHIVSDVVTTLPAENVKVFIGDYEAAYKAALSDYNQYEVEAILGYSGDTIMRSKMDILVRYASGVTLFVPFNKDIDNLTVFESYCRSHSDMLPLLYPATEATKLIRTTNKTPITDFNIGDNGYLNLRAFTSVWYNKLDLPDKFSVTYRFAVTVDSYSNDKHTSIFLTIPLLKRKYEFTHFELKMYLSLVMHKGEVLFDIQMSKKYKLVMKNKP